MVETHKKRKNTVITRITLTISNGEHIKHTLSTIVNLIVISSIYQKFLKTSMELYGWQFDMAGIPHEFTILTALRFWLCKI